MATPNYNYEKRQRELAKKRKKEEKEMRKKEMKDQPGPSDQLQVPSENDTTPADPNGH